MAYSAGRHHVADYTPEFIRTIGGCAGYACPKIPAHLGDVALLELLRRLRFLPSRARRNVSQALLPHVSRLESDLRTIAAHQHGTIRSAAESVLRAYPKTPLPHGAEPLPAPAGAGSRAAPQRGR